MHMSLRRRIFSNFCLLSLLLPLLLPSRPAHAVTCSMQGQMPDDLRNQLMLSSRKIALSIQSGDSSAVKAMTIPNVAAQFDPIAHSIQQVSPLISNAAITIDALYSLDASDLTSAQDTQFFCDAPGSTLHEEVTIPQLPPGKYALALVHAIGVQQPQQFALLMEEKNGWQLAGFFVKPMLVAGHNSVWYWTQARSFARKGEKWNAHFYYATALYLAVPVDFLSTPHLEKLRSEQAAVQAPGLPGDQPLVIEAGGQEYPITRIDPDGSLGALDLAVHYTAKDTSDPVAARSQILQLMRALLKEHPELRDGFHGLWVFADAPGKQPFAIEQTMTEIHSTVAGSGDPASKQ